jgi:plastocyanin
MNKLISLLAAAVILVGFNANVLPAQAATSSLTSLSSGDLIRGSSLPAVYYYGKDGFRYVFPNDKAYFTWYSDFSSIKTLSDADLGAIQIGGNITYKPGSKMIKINSDPKTYAVDESGTLRWVTSESVAVALYGSDWNKKIDDVPDAFFSNYQKGSDIETTGDAEAFNAQFLGNTTVTINDDKSLQAPIIVTISDSGYDNATYTVDAGRAVKFVNAGTEKHGATADDESWGTGTLTSGQSFTRYFKTSGEWTFHCKYHDTEIGTIVVE